MYRWCIDGDKNNIRWVVPKGARWQLCRLNHDEIGHFGVEKTLEEDLLVSQDDQVHQEICHSMH